MYTHAQDTLDQWFFQQLASLTAPADASAVIWLLLAQQHTRHGERDQNLDQWQAPQRHEGAQEAPKNAKDANSVQIIFQIWGANDHVLSPAGRNRKHKNM